MQNDGLNILKFHRGDIRIDSVRCPCGDAVKLRADFLFGILYQFFDTAFFSRRIAVFKFVFNGIYAMLDTIL